ncbi:MAG: hypothetical protein WCG25_07995 [bacterium]
MAFLATFHSAANFFTTSHNHLAFFATSFTGLSIFSSSTISSFGAAGVASFAVAAGAVGVAVCTNFFSTGLLASSANFILNQIFLFLGSRSIIFALTTCHNFTTSFGLLTDFCDNSLRWISQLISSNTLINTQ